MPEKFVSRSLRTAMTLPLVSAALVLPSTSAAAAPATSLAPAAGSQTSVSTGAATAVRTAGAALKSAARPSGLPASAKGRFVSTSRLAVSADVSMLGVTWPTTVKRVSVFVRTTQAGQKASAWKAVGQEQGTEAAKTAGTEPTMVLGKATVEAVVLSDAPVAASLRSYGSQVTGTDAAVASAAAKATADSVSMRAASVTSANATSATGVSGDAVSGKAVSIYRPTIRSRAAWRANQGLVREPYRYGVVTGVMIHHTATSNSYTRSQVPAILRGIQAYHVNGRGWNDIAYNVLVDKYGVAWEGRGGGLTNAVVGGHGMGITNARVFGLSFIGNYDVKKPSSAMLDTAERVIAWKFAMHSVSVYGRTWGSSGALNNISGHRNEKSTSCPGRYVYAKMSTIRAKVATYKQRYYSNVSAAAVRAASR